MSTTPNNPIAPATPPKSEYKMRDQGDDFAVFRVMPSNRLKLVALFPYYTPGEGSYHDRQSKSEAEASAEKYMASA